MFLRTVPTAIHIIIFWLRVFSHRNVKHFYYWTFLEFPFYKVHIHLLKFAELNRYQRAVMKRKENYCYKAGITCNKTELIQCITLTLDNLIIKANKHLSYFSFSYVYLCYYKFIKQRTKKMNKSRINCLLKDCKVKTNL